MINNILELTLDLNRLDASTKAKVIRLLNQAQKELVGSLAQSNLTSFSRIRKQQLLNEARSIIDNYYKKAQTKLFDTLEPIPKVVINKTAKDLSSKLPVSMMAEIPDEATFKTIIDDTLIVGATTEDWWKKQSDDTFFRYSQAVRQGIVLRQTNAEIIRRVVSEMDISRRHAASLVQTSISSVANASRQEVFKANADVIKGFEWITALDEKVCLECAARADKTWTIDEEPIDHNITFTLPPLHNNDRCLITPITKSYKELGFPNIREPKAGERASIDGPVSDKTTFEDFLNSKGDAWQDDVLGKGRAELWRSGKIDLKDLVDGAGSPLTVKQLKEKYG